MEFDPLFDLMDGVELQRFFLKGVYERAVRVKMPLTEFLEKWQYARLIITATDVFNSSCFRSIDEPWLIDEVECNIGIKIIKKEKAVWVIDPLFPQAVLATDLKIIEMCPWTQSV